jgi:non-ribosomal peptide synthetase-like protein
MALWILVRWFFVFLVTVISAAAFNLYATVGVLAVALATVATLFASILYFALVERALDGLPALKPLGCSIYDLEFWRHERFWKLSSVALLAAFNGTPFKNLLWRMMGVKLGRRVFDDGLATTERTFVTIGDDCTFNAGSFLQCHSQEDGAFKSDHVVVGAGCTLGVSAFVHYGVTIGDGAVVGTDAFLMKGEDMPAQQHWAGNPARPMPDSTLDLVPREALPAPVGGQR